MAYSIIKTDGSLLTEIVDSAIDQTATDLTLIGKNVSGYGEYINDNFVRLLENFAAETQPNNPIAGQLWFDTAENRLKVYDGGAFRIGSGPLVTGAQPTNLTQGDLWIDSVENQLWFYDGIDLTLAGPIYKNSQGLSGHVVESIVDTNNASRIIVKMYVGTTLLGIFSGTSSTFTPATAIPGFSGDISPGFNQSSLPGIKFNVTASKADALVDALGNSTTPSNFLRTDQNTSTTGNLSILNANPLSLGLNQNVDIIADSLLTVWQNNSLNANWRMRIRNNQGYWDAITVSAPTRKVGIWTPSPAYSLDVTGDVRITGNLLVDGASTTISSSHLSVEDHQILLAVNSDSTQDDIYADYGGIIVKGTTDHSMLWKNSSTAWVMSENLDITEASSGARAYRINGVNVLEYTGSVYRLSAAVTSAPGITALGVQTELTVDNLYLNSNRIQSLNTNGDIEIEPNGSGNVALVGSPKITGLADPTSSTDAVNKQSLEAYVRARNFAFSMDITGLTNTDIASQLNQIAPHEYYEINTEARIHCTKQVVSYSNVNLTATTAPVTTGDFVKHFISVDNSGNVGTKPNEAVLQDFDINPINLGNATITVTRINKLFRLVSDSTSSQWQFITDF
jgi:hypothetical protein